MKNKNDNFTSTKMYRPQFFLQRQQQTTLFWLILKFQFTFYRHDLWLQLKIQPKPAPVPRLITSTCISELWRNVTAQKKCDCQEMKSMNRKVYVLYLFSFNWKLASVSDKEVLTKETWFVHCAHYLFFSEDKYFYFKKSRNANNCIDSPFSMFVHLY